MLKWAVERIKYIEAISLLSFHDIDFLSTV